MNTDVVLEADVLVIGCGMGGMTAAYRAATHGARVVAVDRAPRIGGSAVLSNGCLWTVPTYDVLRERCPTGDPELGRAFLDRFPATVELVRSSGVWFSEPVTVLYGAGHRFDVLGFVQRAARAVEAAGGWVLPGRTVESLLVEDGAVVGARARDADGAVELRAPATLLATGGFQGNSALLQDHFGDRARQLLLRGNPYSCGEGMRLATAAGAATVGRMDTFYGHLIAWPLPEFLPKDFSRMAVSFSVRSVLVNTRGERFVDESLGDHRSAQATAGQPTGRALVLFDDTVRQGAARQPTVAGFEQVDKVEEAARAGARVASAPTWSALGDVVTRWGFDGAAAAASVDAFNTHVAGDGGALPVPRRWNRDPLVRPPFHAMEAKAGITFTQGGLRIDGNARVLDEAGSPIPGLYAAGADTGGVFDGGYAGGLALAAVFADLAVTSAGIGA